MEQKNQVWLELTLENIGKILQPFTKNYTNIVQTASPFQRIPVIQLVLFQLHSLSKTALTFIGEGEKKFYLWKMDKKQKFCKRLGKQHVANALSTDKELLWRS